MRELGELVRGEMLRMRRYHITAASLVVVVIWIVMLQLAGIKNITASLPLVLFMDATMMSLLLVGVMMLFEKQEGVTRSIFVLPIDPKNYLAAKLIGAIGSSVLTLALLLVYTVLIHGAKVDVIGLFAGVVLVAAVFGLLGAVMTYRVRDFTGLLMATFVVIFSLGLPTILQALEVIGGEWVTRLQHINPTKSALIILAAGVEPVPAQELWTAVAYISVLGAAFLGLAVRGLGGYAAREFGG